MDINTLSTEELAGLEKLISSAERNKNEAQQLALDAGKLLTIPQERLNDYKDREFFKRCIDKFRGKQGEMLRANQKDLIEMQKYAWVYLMKLQEQNLIQAQTIMVIRNNLQELAEVAADTRNAIAILVQKFDARITKLEDCSAIHGWFHQLDIKKFDSNHRTICLLQIAFDYFSVLQRNSISYNQIDADSDLKVAMKKFGINADEVISIDKLIKQLYEEILVIKIAKFNELISVAIEGETLSSDFILENVSGVAYNAIYTVQKELNSSIVQAVLTEVSEERILNALRQSVVQPETEYSLIDLAKELVAGTILAEQIYRELHELPSVDSSVNNNSDGDASVLSLLARYTPVAFHAFLQTSPTIEEQLLYLESFSLILASTGTLSDSQKNYLYALNDLFKCESCMDRIELLFANPKKLDVRAIVSVLNSPARQYAWFVDAIFLGSAEGKDPKAMSVVLEMSKILNFKTNEIAPFLEQVEILTTQNNPVEIFGAVRNVNAKTDAWKTILDFKKISLKGAFDEVLKKIESIVNAGQELCWSQVDQNIQRSDEVCGLLMREITQLTMTSGVRKKWLREFKYSKSRCEQFEASARNLNSDLNKILSIFGTDPVFYKVDFDSIVADEFTSRSNDNWDSNTDLAFDALYKCVDCVCDTLMIQRAQLQLYEDGRYQESAVANLKKGRQEGEQKIEQETEKKQTVMI